MMARHSEEEGREKRKKLWQVFFLLLVITIVELIIGFKAKAIGLQTAMGKSTISLKFIFVTLTLVKAAYIVLSFMHLGHEKKNLRYTILAPYIIFIIYLIFICLTEADYSFDFRLFSGFMGK